MRKWKMKTPLILASGSPRRSELLAGVGFGFTVLPSECEEPLPAPGEAPSDYAMRAALTKARDVAAKAPDACVLGADTIVVLGEEVLGKPRDPEHALAMLQRLTEDDGRKGRDHHVITGCALIHKGEERIFHVSTQVRMINWPLELLREYAYSGEPMDKAGAYAIQGGGAFLVRELQGSYTNVVGLPLAEVVEVLVEWRVVIPRQR